MNKKIVMALLVVFVFVLGVLIINKPKEKEVEEEPLDNSFLTSTVIKIDNNYVTFQDKNNVTKTFLVNDMEGLDVGSNVLIECKGELKEDSINACDFVGLEVVEPTIGAYPESFNDDGIFSKFYESAYEKLKTMSLNEKIGQILLVRVPEKNAVEDLKKYKFGGYLLFKRDFDNKNKNQVISMINNFQNNSKIPLLIAVDEEGGDVTRLSKNKELASEPFKSPSELYKEGGMELIKSDTIKKSKILKDLGINLNLAPVVDVSTNPSDYMYKRAIELDAVKTATYAKTVIEASKSNSVSYTLKHFPGYGNNLDTHVGESVDKRTLEEIMQNDILPFKSGIEAGAEAVLVSHNIVTSIDKNNPASLSKSVHNLLRSDLKFTGIIITDDLSMSAINDDKAVLKPIEAGNDLLIVTDYSKAFNDIKKSLTNGELKEEILDKLVFRVLAWKYYKGLLVSNQK